MTEIVRRQRRKQLTDLMVAALPRRRAPYFFPDVELPKHGIRIRPVGPGTYTVITRDIYKKQRWVKIGNTAEMTIKEARAKARKVIERVEAGLAPVETKLQPDSVEDIAQQWLARHVEGSKLRTAVEMRRIAEHHIIKHWRKRIFVDIGRTDISALLDHVEDNHGARTADTVLTVLRSMAVWHAKRVDGYLLPFVRGMQRVPSKTGERERVLSDAELKKVWDTAGDAGAFGALVRLLLCVGQRLSKVVDIRHSDIADGVWTIRTEKDEKGNAGKLLLPPLALEIIEAQPRFVGNDFVFGQNHAGFNTRHKRMFDAKSGVLDWVLHDLRRTAKTLMSRVGVLPHISEHILGHKVGKKIERNYDKHDYTNEKADGLRRLAAEIERIVNPPTPTDNVVQFKAAAS
jgi:integrase